MRRYKLSLLCISASLLLAVEAHAQTCASYPNTLTNGTTADANQVMANFNCAALLGGAGFTGNVSFTGEVAVGTTAFSPGYALDVWGAGRFLSPNAGSTGAVIIRDAAGNPQAAYVQFVNNSNSAQLGYILGLNAGGLDLAGGNIGINTPSPSLQFFVNGSSGGTTVWTNTSDARLKKNVVPITGALDLVERLRGVRFDWRAPAEREVGKNLTLPLGERQIGFIAQEVAVVVPEAVMAPKAGAGDTYAVKDTNLIPILVEAVKEQQAEIRELRAEVAALRAGK